MIRILITVFLISIYSSFAEADLYGVVDSAGDFQFISVPTHTVRMNNRSYLKRPFEKTIQRAADRYALDPNLLSAVIKSESNFNPYAVSHKGARGLMQLMPQTARILKVPNINNPIDNIHGGARYLRRLLDWFEGSRILAAAAYNAGSQSVKKYGGVPPFKETEKYVNKVLAHYVDYRRQQRE